MRDAGAEGPVFKSQPRRCRITVLGKLFTPIVTLFTSSEIGSSPLKGCEVALKIEKSHYLMTTLNYGFLKRIIIDSLKWLKL